MYNDSAMGAARRRFLTRPFWRVWVLAGVFIALGFMLTAPGAPLHPAAGLALFFAGLGIFCCAVGYAHGAPWNRSPAADNNEAVTAVKGEICTRGRF
jgi:hypothetical protein